MKDSKGQSKEDAFPMIQLFITSLLPHFSFLRIEDEQKEEEVFLRLPQQNFPSHLKEKVQRFHRPEDRQYRWLSYFLLKKAFQRCFQEEINFHHLLSDSHGRPYLKFFQDRWDFNLSHAGESVVLAFPLPSSSTFGVRVGVDIEKIRQVSLKDFSPLMNEGEWSEIYAHPRPLEKFFEYWSLKESVIKADGRGLALPLQEITKLSSFKLRRELGKLLPVQCQGKIWFCHKVEINSGYSCFVTSNDPRELTTPEFLEI